MSRSAHLLKLNDFLKFASGEVVIVTLNKFRDKPPDNGPFNTKPQEEHICEFEEDEDEILERPSTRSSIHFDAELEDEGDAHRSILSQNGDSSAEKKPFGQGNNYRDFNEKLKQKRFIVGLSDQQLTGVVNLDVNNYERDASLPISFSSFDASSEEESEDDLFQNQRTKGRPIKKIEKYQPLEEIAGSWNFFCPLCFQSFPGKHKLGYHLQFDCSVVETGCFTEPAGVSLFQIVHNGISCTTCKAKIRDGCVEQHVKAVHPNSTVSHIFCSICRINMLFTMNEVSRHCDTKDHQELLKMRIDQRRRNIIQILRENSYCLQCKLFLPFYKLGKHVTSSCHNSLGSEVVFWCFYCEMSIQSRNVVSHCREVTHQYNSSLTFFCVFCNQVLKLQKFIEHVIECVTENS